MRFCECLFRETHTFSRTPQITTVFSDWGVDLQRRMIATRAIPGADSADAANPLISGATSGMSERTFARLERSSGVRPHRVTSTNMVSSTHSSFLLARSFMANQTSHTAVRFATYRSSGSRVRLPTRMTRLKLAIIHLSFDVKGTLI